MLVLMSPETRVPQTHPLRAIKKLADEALAKLSPVFDAMYAEVADRRIPPDRLLFFSTLLEATVAVLHRLSANGYEAPERRLIDARVPVYADSCIGLSGPDRESLGARTPVYVRCRTGLDAPMNRSMHARVRVYAHQ